MEEWKDYIGKDLKIIFEDGEGHVSKKEGLFIGIDEGCIFLRTEFKKEGISISRIIRVEVKNG